MLNSLDALLLLKWRLRYMLLEKEQVFILTSTKILANVNEMSIFKSGLAESTIEIITYAALYIRIIQISSDEGLLLLRVISNRKGQNSLLAINHTG